MLISENIKNKVVLLIMLLFFICHLAFKIGGYEFKSTRAKSGAEEGIIKNLMEMIEKL